MDEWVFPQNHENLPRHALARSTTCRISRLKEVPARSIDSRTNEADALHDGRKAIHIRLQRPLPTAVEPFFLLRPRGVISVVEEGREGMGRNGQCIDSQCPFGQNARGAVETKRITLRNAVGGGKGE